jgi:hypothetical protein
MINWPGFLVRETAESGVFLRQALQPLGKLVPVRLRLRLNCHRNNRFGEGRRLEQNVKILAAQGIPRGDVLEPDQRRDVPGKDRVHIDPLVRLDHHHPADPLPFAGPGIINHIALLQLAAVNAEENQLAHIRIAPQLECERTKLRAVVRRHGDRHVRLGGVQPLGRRHVQRRRQIVNHRVDQRLHAALFESRTTQHRHQLETAGQTPDRLLQGRHVHRLVLDHQLGDGVVLVRHRVDQLGQRILGPLALFLGHLGDRVAHPGVVGFVVNQRLLGNDIDHAAQVVFLPHRQHHRIGVGTQLPTHFGHRVFKVRPHPVHLVHERDARNIVLGGLAPDGFRLRLHSGDAAENRHRPVQNPHGPLDFGREIDVPRRVDDVDPVRDAHRRLRPAIFLLGPVTRGRRGGDGDAALALLLHPIRDGIAVIHIAHAMDEPRVKEDALGGGRLAGIDVRRNPNVAGTLHRIRPLAAFTDPGLSLTACIKFLIQRLKTPRRTSMAGRILRFGRYQRKWANALFAWAILCTSSRLRIAFP